MGSKPGTGSNPLTIQWVILALGLAALGLALGGNLAHDRGRILGEEKQRLLVQAGIIQRLIEEDLISLNKVLSDLGAHYMEDGHSRDISHDLGLLCEVLPGVRTLTIFDADGTATASNRPGLAGKNFRHREHFMAIVADPNPDMLYLSPPFESVLGAYTLTAGRMITGPDGKFTGVVHAGLDPDYFRPLMNSVLYSPDMRATLAHGQGTLFVVAPPRPDMEGKNIDQPGSFFSRHKHSGRDAGVFEGRSFASGEERILAAEYVRPPGLTLDNTLEVTVSRNPASLYAGWAKNAWLQGGAYALVVACSAGGLFLFQRRQRRHEETLGRAALALAERERFIRTVTNGIPGMVGYWDQELRCRYANKAYLEWFGKTPEEMDGITMQELMGETLFARNEPYVRAALAGERQVFERTLTKADGSTGYTLARYIPDKVKDKVYGFVVLVSDVTELKLTQLELERRVLELDVLASTDALTGLANRRHFLERAKEELVRSKRYHLPMSFLMLDLDHFKAVNDTHGHDVGDEVLRALAAILKDAMRETDLAGRLGGEEFGALLIQTGADQARPVAERLNKAVREALVPAATGDVRFTVSIGITECKAGEECSVEDLMKRADLALYRAKQTGRDKTCCHGEE